MAYLVEKYDPENKISVSNLEEKYHQLQWLMFQVSGQGSVHSSQRTAFHESRS
jgi:glutathione S-transferase